MGLVRVLRAKVQPPEIPAIHVSPRFSRTDQRANFLTVFTIMIGRQRYCLDDLSVSYILARRSHRIRIFPGTQNAASQFQICVFSANATQLLLPAGIRQPTRRLCTRIGCRSRAPVDSDQSEGMKECTVTADPREKDQASEYGVRSSGWVRRKEDHRTSCIVVFFFSPAISPDSCLFFFAHRRRVSFIFSYAQDRISTPKVSNSHQPNLNANSPRHTREGLQTRPQDGRRTIAHRRKPSHRWRQRSSGRQHECPKLSEEGTGDQAHTSEVAKEKLAAEYTQEGNTERW